MKKIILAVTTAFLLVSGAINAQVNVKKAESPDSRYPFVKGNLLLSKDNVKLNYVKNTEIRLDTLKLKNIGNKPMTLGFQSLPPHMNAVAQPALLAPKQEGIVVVKYNAALKNDAITILIENSRYFGIEHVFPNQMKDAIHQL